MDNKKILIVILSIILIIFTCLFFIKNKLSKNTTEVHTQEEVLLPETNENTCIQKEAQTEEEEIQISDKQESTKPSIQVKTIQQPDKQQNTPLKIQEETKTSISPSQVSQLDVQVEYNPKNFEVPIKFKSTNIKKFVYTPDGFYK